MVRIKICGITSAAEAQLAVDQGAHAIGMLVGRVHVAPDFIAPDVAQTICRSLPPLVASVLVTHVDDADGVMRLADASGRAAAQRPRRVRVGGAAPSALPQKGDR